MATDFHWEKSNVWREHRPQDLRPKHIGFKASHMNLKVFSAPPPPHSLQFKAFSRVYKP